MQTQPKALPDGSIMLASGTILPPIYRQDGTTIEPIERITGKGETRVVELQRFEPVVFPDGKVVAEPLASGHSGLRWMKVIEGTATLTRRAKSEGVVSYREMCLGRIPGVAADPKSWAYWVAVKRERGKSRIPARGTLPPEKLYHPECARRAKANAGGVERMDQDTIDALMASVEAEMSAEDVAEAEERAAEMAAPHTPESADELVFTNA